MVCNRPWPRLFGAQQNVCSRLYRVYWHSQDVPASPKTVWLAWFLHTKYERWRTSRIVARFLNAAKGVKRGLRHIGPLVKEREGLEARYGKEWQERPVRRIFSSPMTPSLRRFHEQNDILTWLVEISKGQEPWTAREITSYILLINFAAIHTTTLARKPTVAHKSFAYTSRRPSHIQYMTWQRIRNTLNLYVKKSKQLSRKKAGARLLSRRWRSWTVLLKKQCGLHRLGHVRIYSFTTTVHLSNIAIRRHDATQDNEGLHLLRRHDNSRRKFDSCACFV